MISNTCSLSRLTLAAGLAVLAMPGTLAADEGGVSFWLPGQYASFAAAPSDPGLSLAASWYHESTRARAGAAFLRGGGVQIGARSRSDFLMLDIAYTFETKVLGASAALGMSALVGANTIKVDATLTGPGGGTLSGRRRDSAFGIGDLTPVASLYWTEGVHNFMVYGMTGIPVGKYDRDRLAGLGLGHWAVDLGGGYTYWDEASSLEFSVVLGFTCNFRNPHTNYRSGIDSHLDWAISWPFIGSVRMGAAGYAYRQLTGDSGAGATLGSFKSRVMGIGPQLGLTLPVGSKEADLNVRAYREFGARYRLEGWNVWVGVSLSL